MMPRSLFSLALLSLLSGTSGFSVVTTDNNRQSTSLNMVDQNVLMGAGVAFAGLSVGIGMVAFTENQGERARERGGGLSDDMSTRIAGSLLEDVEVSSVSDVASLASQLESALKETGAADTADMELSEADKKRIAEEADDGW
ncbi:expressed unknown protein [Seminavis robusta]|uniref:Uncharacterized protein n=1 Tax=Seminavis robusta TaxID=568900 RepID=A0A9N8DPS2_9STRA|nr:expressed unknown protein [Seminavis robusta]|eukprot:Sro199_g084320.1 n/a (142) ;mRNA; f:30706-31228